MTNTWEQFRDELHTALLHIFDPDYQPPVHLCSVIGCGSRAGTGTVQAIVIQAIERLQPSAGLDSDSKSGRLYATLYQRFVLGLTQEETAEQLGLSVRHLGRVQREAIHLLARQLWEAHLTQQNPTASSHPERDLDEEVVESPLDTDRIPDWRDQIAGDLAPIQTSAPGATADLGKVIQEVCELESVLTAERGITLSVNTPHTTLTAAVHPSVLRQVMIMTLGWLIQNTTESDVTIKAAAQGEHLQTIISSETVSDYQTPDIALQQQMLTSFGGSIQAVNSSSGLQFQIVLPNAGDITVLVVDDNPDMIYFYRRCTDGTRYRVVHENHGSRIWEAIETHAPQIIVLDIMLPDVDGWQLLARLHQHPDTREIPIITCSVIREKDLALALGAALYLTKPLSHQQFREALDQIVSQMQPANLAA